jgi:hypothetical protein
MDSRVKMSKYFARLNFQNIPANINSENAHFLVFL